MKSKNNFYIKIVIILLAIIFLGYYVASNYEQTWIKMLIYTFSALIALVTLYFEFNKQYIYQSSVSLFDEVDIKKSAKYIKRSERLDILGMFGSSRSVVAMFLEYYEGNYDAASKINKQYKPLFDRKPASKKLSLYMSILISFKTGSYKTTKDFINAYEKIDIPLTSDYTNAYYVKSIQARTEKKDMLSSLQEAYDHERNNLMKELIKLDMKEM